MNRPDPIVLPGLSMGTARHGFFTRTGGVSGGVFRSLNCGWGSQDDTANVRANRARAADMLEVRPPSLLTAHQVHGTNVATLTQPWDPADAPKADALVSRTPGLALGVLTADCAPILFHDAEAGVIGAAHAGWRGALAGVIAATVAAMGALGARAEATRAAIGPCIGWDSYEVGPEFPAPFLAEDGANAKFFRQSARESHHLFDLASYCAGKLEALGLKGIELASADTCAAPERFFSYRRACLTGETDYGRGLSAIALTG